MNTEEIKRLFAAGINCGQQVSEVFADRLGLDRAELRRLTSCMGGGLGQGETCGAVNAAMLVLGMVYGYSEENDAGRKADLQGKMVRFREKFLERHPGTLCRELLGRKIPEEMPQILEEGTMFTKCPGICQDAVAILEELLPPAT